LDNMEEVVQGFGGTHLGDRIEWHSKDQDPRISNLHLLPRYLWIS